MNFFATLSMTFFLANEIYRQRTRIVYVSSIVNWNLCKSIFYWTFGNFCSAWLINYLFPVNNFFSTMKAIKILTSPKINSDSAIFNVEMNIHEKGSFLNWQQRDKGRIYDATVRHVCNAWINMTPKIPLCMLTLEFMTSLSQSLIFYCDFVEFLEKRVRDF